MQLQTIYFRIPERDIVSGVPKSEYIRPHLCGEAKEALLIINSVEGTYIWDAAYYKEKYYVYFGIVPEAVLFLPYYLITGKDLSTMAVIVFEGGLFIPWYFCLIGSHNPTLVSQNAFFGLFAAGSFNRERQRHMDLFSKSRIL